LYTGLCSAGIIPSIIGRKCVMQSQKDANEGLIIGIDLTAAGVQMCYYSNQEKSRCIQVQPNDNVAEYALPQGVEQLFSDRPQQVDVLILARFLEELLDRAKTHAGRTKIEKIGITVAPFTKNILDVIRQAMERLLMPKQSWMFISHEESCAYYAYSQKQELYVSGVALIEYDRKGLRIHRYYTQRSGQDGLILEECTVSDSERLMAAARKEISFAEVEAELIDCIQNAIPPRTQSAIYLTGEVFLGNTFSKEFTQMLCTGRKAFSGQNLFVRGACLGAYEDVHQDVFDHVLLACTNRIQVGMDIPIVERGMERIMRLVKAGTNWYMSERTLDFIVDDIRVIPYTLRLWNNEVVLESQIDLSEIPYREDKKTRIRMTLAFADATAVKITIEDRGFGQFAESSQKVITQQILLEDKQDGKEEVIS